MAMSSLAQILARTAAFESRSYPSSDCGSTPGFYSSSRSKGKKNHHRLFFGGSSARAVISRFPPNFVRQLSIKARRNCGNIGVAQISAATVTNAPLSSDSEAVQCNSTGGDGGDGAVSCNNVNNSSALVQSSDIGSDHLSAAGDKVLAPVGTLAVHSGEKSGRVIVTDAITTPIVQTSTYIFKNTAELIGYQEGTFKSYEYGRYGNPTTQVAEDKISALEGAETTLLLASGMCATTTMMMALVPAGGHIITTTDCYRRTRQFIQTILPKMGITATVIDPSDIESLELALEQNTVSLFFSESPTNPYLRCIDIELVSKLCHRRGALVCIDSTFATPVNQKALELGADIVLHSVTKYIGGHNDVLAGSLSGPSKVIDPIRAYHNVLGGVLSPNAAYLILRGIKTLHLRVREQNKTAFRIAKILEAHPKISRVHYPGLESHPDHKVARKQMSGFGGVVSFEVSGDLEATSKFIDSLKIPYIGPSLGGCESLVEQPTIISYWDQSPSERARLGIKDNLVRFSCGVEDYDDLKSDILNALDTL